MDLPIRVTSQSSHSCHPLSTMDLEGDNHARKEGRKEGRKSITRHGPRMNAGGVESILM
jgi:hypothetical protein